MLLIIAKSISESAIYLHILSLDSPYDQAERYLSYGSGIYFIVVMWFIYLQGSIQSWFTPFTSVASNLPDYLAIASLTAISFAIGYFIKYLGIHKYADRVIFRFEKKVNRYIINCLRTYFDNEFANKNKCRCPEDRELMDIFFEFINKQADSWLIQRALSFSYWLKYRLSLNLFILSIFGIILAVVTNLFANNLHNKYSGLTLSFFIIVACLALAISQLKIRRELISTITRLQIYRIIYDSKTELDTLLNARFTTNRRNYGPNSIGYK
jgi:hypothetical protein